MSNNTFNINKAIVAARTLQLTAHAAHHLASGGNFLSDHEMFSDTYEAAEGAYDDLVELAIGNGFTPIFEILSGRASAAKVSDIVGESEKDIETVLALENSFFETCNLARKDASRDIDTLLGDIMRDAGKRIYKYQRRLA